MFVYLTGKETNTLSKVLCAVVKFDDKQQQEISAAQQQVTHVSTEYCIKYHQLYSFNLVIHF